MLYLPKVNVVRFERCPRYDNDTGIVCFPPPSTFAAFAKGRDCRMG